MVLEALPLPNSLQLLEMEIDSKVNFSTTFSLHTFNIGSEHNKSGKANNEQEESLHYRTYCAVRKRKYIFIKFKC